MKINTCTVSRIMQGNHHSTHEDFLTNHEGKKFNSPNDIALGRMGILYFSEDKEL